MNRDQLIAELADKRLAAKKNVTNRQRMLDLIRGDLEQLTTDELQAEHDHAHGRINRDAMDYSVRDIDHAISLALDLLHRGWNHHDIAIVLTNDHGPTIAGRALAHALAGEYRESQPRTTHLRSVEPAGLQTLAEYLATNPDAAKKPGAAFLAAHLPHLEEPAPPDPEPTRTWGAG